MKTRYTGPVTALLAALIASDASAANTNFNLCFNPSSANWTGVNVDGILDGDGGWINAFQYIFDNGSNSPDVAVRAKSDGTNLYFGVEVKNDPSFDDQDAIVLAFATGATTYSQLVVYPMHQGTGASGSPREIDFLKGSGPSSTPVTWDIAKKIVNPIWANAKSTSATGAINSWNTEISIPISQIFPVTPGGPFAFYMNVVRVDTHDPNQNNWAAREFPWPRHDMDSTIDTNIIDDINLLPAPDAWGTGKLNGNSCGGVFINVADVHTNNANSALISVDQPNVFQTQVHNTSIDKNGNPKGADGVFVTFSYSDWGMYGTTGPWNQIPAPANPTSPQSLGPGSTTLFQTGGWTAPQAMLGAHWCVQAALSSTSNDTTFLNRATWHNMHVAHGSELVATAIVAGAGLPPPPAGKTSYTFRIDVVPSLQFAYADGNLPAIPMGTLTAQLTLLFHGAYYRDRKLNIQGKKFEIVDAVSSYGLVVQHALPPAVQQAWEGRHEELAAIAKRLFSAGTGSSEGSGQDDSHLQRTMMAAQLNEQLAADAEKPPIKDWSWRTPQLKPLGDGGLTFTLDVPKGGKVPLTTTASYHESSGGAPSKTCATCSFSSGSDATASVALVFAVALVVRRRRRVSRQ